MGNHFNWKAIGLHDDTTAEVGQTIRVKAVDENNLPIEWETASAQVDWDEVTNKPFIKISGDTLTWDGNTEGLVNVDAGDGGYFYKVSDSVPKIDDFANGYTIVIDGSSVNMSADNIGIIADGVIICATYSFVVIAEEAVNVVVDGLAFPEAGIYFAYYLDDNEIIAPSSLTINGYAGFSLEKIAPSHLYQVDWNQNDETQPDVILNKPFGSLSDGTVKQLDEKFIPESVKIGRNVTGTQYIIDDETVIADRGAEIFNAYTLNKAVGDYSHAEGYYTTASGSNSHAEGSRTTASGDVSHAEGAFNTASGGYSHAEGNGTIASGSISHAEGNGTIASGASQHVQGRNNIESTKHAHIVGNGATVDARSNAHTLDWDGNAWFQGDVYVGGTGQDDTAAVKLSKEGHTHAYTWSKVANKPFIIKGTPDTLTWDGNTEGLVCVSDMAYKVSDVVPTIADLSNGSTYTSSLGNTTTVAADSVNTLPNGVIYAGAFIVPENAVGVEVETGGIVFPKSGVYFVKDTEEEYITSLTIPGYTGFGTEVIDTKVLPEHLQFGETTVQGDTLTWDGNAEGLANIDGKHFKVSDAVLTKADLANGCSFIMSGQTVSLTGEEAQSGWADDGFGILTEGVLIVPYDNYTDEYGTIEEMGVYFLKIDGNYVSSLTIPGYSGFTKTEIKPIEEKFIPDTVPTIQSATVGQTIRVSAVDENGVPTAWEAFDPFVLTDESTGTKYKLTVVDSKLTMTEVTV